jgi:hypothetical protein
VFSFLVVFLTLAARSRMRVTFVFLIASGALLLGLVVCLAVGLPIMVSVEHEQLKQFFIVKGGDRAAVMSNNLRLARPQMKTIGLAVCSEPTRERFEESVSLLREMSVVGTLSWISIVPRTAQAQSNFLALINASYGINVTITQSKLSSLDAVVTFL